MTPTSSDIIVYLNGNEMMEILLYSCDILKIHLQIYSELFTQEDITLPFQSNQDNTSWSIT